MDKIQFEKMLKPLITIFDKIELDLIRDIIVRVENYDNVKGSLKWYLDKLGETKLLEKDSLKEFKKNKSKIKKEIKSILTKAGHNVDNLDTFNNYYEKGFIDVNPTKIYDSTTINNIITNALKDGDSIINLIQTKAIEGTSLAYKDILNKAYVETASGIYTYTESIRRALNKYAENGIQTVHYKNGKYLSIESVVRRDVKTRVNKLSSDIILQHAKDLGTNLVYVDQHLGARVRTKYMKHDYEAHAEWQGKKYMIDGSSSEYPNLYEATGLDEMLGLYGINCYHNMRPTWEWEKINPVIDEVENAKKYEQLQTQRGYERKIRKLKRKQLIAKETGNVEELKKIKEKISKTNSEFNDYLKENHLTRDYNREYIVKTKTVGLSANENYTLENHPKPILLGNINPNKQESIDSLIKTLENQIKNDKIENAIVITKKGEIYQCYGNKTNVWPDIDLGDKLFNAYVTHNHPIEETNYSFSKDDIILFEKYSLNKLRGIDKKYTYELNRNGKPNILMPTISDDVEDNSLCHVRAIEYALKHNISYKRWKNDKGTT